MQFKSNVYDLQQMSRQVAFYTICDAYKRFCVERKAHEISVHAEMVKMLEICKMDEKFSKTDDEMPIFKIFFYIFVHFR